MKDRRLNALPGELRDSILDLTLNACSRLKCLHFMPLADPEQVGSFAFYAASGKPNFVTGGGVPIDTMPGSG